MLVDSWPVVLGCDAGGVVVELGPGASKFKIGDEVCGCTRLGVPGYSTFQEYVWLSPETDCPIGSNPLTDSYI